MTGRVLMVQGTASSVGKSVLVTALCRLFAAEGLRVAPFKAQNMSNNSYVTPNGLEVGRAQAEQARAARIDLDVRMNPVLLKPEADHRSQVVLLGRPSGHLDGASFLDKRRLWPAVRRSLDSLRAEFDLVVIEGAGSPAEINLKRGDIVNMRLARYAGAPVLLVGDIDRGGVFAHLAGTLALLTRGERELVRGFLINKFRGNRSLLDPGLQMIERRTSRPVLGVVPYIPDLGLADEDAVALERRESDGGRMPAVTPASRLTVAVVRLPHISNFDDFDPLAAEPNLELRYVDSAAAIAAADLVILPGTKTTLADLRWLHQRGLGAAVIDAAANGVPVIGVCGGLQMLGKRLEDPDGFDGAAGAEAGLGLLDVCTRFSGDKITRRVQGRVLHGRGILEGADGLAFGGYEVHTGDSVGGSARCLSLQRLPAGESRPDGILDQGGFIFGTYVHGLFANDDLRHVILANAARRRGKALAFAARWDADAAIDRLAAVVRESIDLDRISQIAGL